MLDPDRDPGRTARHAKLLPDAAAHAVRLLDVADRACAEAARHAESELWNAAAGLELELGTDYDEYGTTMSGASPPDLFEDASALHAAIASATNVGRTLALPLLALVDPATATPLVIEGLRLGERDYFENFVEAWLSKSLAWSAERLGPSVDASVMGDLWVTGKLRLDRITDAQIATVPVDRIAAAVRGTSLGYFHQDDARRVMAAHPELGSFDASVAFLEALDCKVDSHAASAFTLYLVELFGRRAYAPAEPIVLRLHDRTSGRHGSAGIVHDSALTTLFALQHRPTLERVAATLRERVASAKPKWDPHHTVPELRAPIRATFALDPATATERFAPFFAARAIASESGAKIAHDILVLGWATMTDHHGTVLGTGDPIWLDRDPRWGAIAARLAAHPRLKRTAASIAKRLSGVKPSTQKKTKKAAPAKKKAAPAKKKAAPAKKKAAPAKRRAAVVKRGRKR